jgi:hypothetical protein
MRRSKWHAIGICSVTAALFFLPPSSRAAHFNYLYIEAGEGNSSGGHVAIQFDDDIYHYQHVSPGLIRLFRRDKAEFHFLYRYLQNRPLHLTRVEVSKDTFERLKDQFKWQFLIQERQFERLEDLRLDRAFIRRLLQHRTGGSSLDGEDSAAILRLRGVGLFYPESGRQPEFADNKYVRHQSLDIQRLRHKVDLNYGTDFLLRKRQGIEAQIRALTPPRWPVMNSDDGSVPASVYSFNEKYSDLLTSLLAIKALTEAPPLQAGALLSSNRRGFEISEAERAILMELRNDLESGLIEVLDSNRPDWGYAVLVDLARILAIDASLRSGYWTFIDDFADDSERVGPDRYQGHEPRLRTLIDDAGATLSRLRRAALPRRRLTEADYSRIEMAANRYLELLKSEQYREFRYNGEKALPSRSIGFPDGPLPNLTKEHLSAALSELDRIESGMLEMLKQRYRYDLITRNCVTELFRTIDRALLASYRDIDRPADSEALTIKESEKRLGGYIDPIYNFIPFISYRSVGRQYRVTLIRDLESYRGLELTKLKARENEVVAALRETNVLTGRLYKYNPDDALFVFFTDRQVMLRPLFGLFNTAAGIGQSVAGLFSWPLDSGQNLKSGATGILMSLPELLFFNMRKGSYQFLSFNQADKAQLADDER